MSGDAAPSGSTATRNCWLATYKSFSGCAGPPTFAGWRQRSPPCSTPTVTPSQALRSYAWPSPAGDLLLIPGAVSFYDGYALRSLRPAAAVVNYGVPYPEYPTSAREAACMLALQAAVTADNRAAEADIERAAVRTGVQAVIRCDGEGFVHVCDEAPLFAVKGKKVYTPPAPPSVERELACRAVEAARLPLLELEIGREQLARFDEIFYVDHRGLTSLSACEGQLYAAIITERIARVLNKLY